MHIEYKHKLLVGDSLDETKRIVTVCDYGKIVIKLRVLMEKRKITRYQLSKMTNTRFEVINKWYEGEVERIDSDVLARFCYVLDCQVTDIIEYVVL